MSTQQYSGSMIRDLQLMVDKYPRRSSVTSGKGWQILSEARLHLCGDAKEWPPRAMTAGDVQAWMLIADIQDELMKQPSPTCLAEMARHSEDCYAEVCGKNTVDGTDFCAEHVKDGI